MHIWIAYIEMHLLFHLMSAHSSMYDSDLHCEVCKFLAKFKLNFTSEFAS